VVQWLYFGLGNWGIMVRFPAAKRVSSHLWSAYTRSGAHTVS